MEITTFIDINNILITVVKNQMCPFYFLVFSCQGKVAMPSKHMSCSQLKLMWTTYTRTLLYIYEGGYFHGQGVYRSEVNSCMNNNVPYFSTWSRQIAVERIKAIAVENFDFEDFVAKDSREWGNKFLNRSGGGVATAVMHNPAPIVKKGSPLDYIKK